MLFRSGVSAKNGVLTYELNQPADFFPTMLTYTPYTPINSHFYAAHKNDYGTKKDTILYCGPFLLDDFTSQNVTYKKNPNYWDADAVKIDTVQYSVADASLGASDQRTAFDEGRVDGFGLSIEDSVGWDMYIKGSDGTGTIQNPASDLVNNRELDDVDYTYHAVLNQNRAINSNSYKNSAFYARTGWGSDKIEADIANTNKALKLRELRKLVLEGIDLATFNEHYKAPERDQYQINTFTPRGYVYDGAGVDYVDYYYAYYAEQKGLAASTDTFATKVEAGKAAVGPQQIAGVNLTNDANILAKYPWLSADLAANRAKQAVNLYNDAHSSDPITLPINIEYLGIGAISGTVDANEKAVVNLWNERANGCAINASRAQATGLPTCKDAYGTDDYPYFYLRLSQSASQDKLSDSANNGYYSIYTGWGWVGDYADPLTYMHCYVTDGEMSKMSGNNDVNALNYRLSEDGTTLTEEKLFESYNAACDAANEERSSTTTRYQEFAKVEYQLLNDLYIIRPLAMYTQGWTASVSRAAGYENPKAHYGLADHILKGMWVLVDVPTGAERKDCRDRHEIKEKEALAAVGGNAVNGAFDN